MKKKRIALLGSTGSIGINALNVIRSYPDRFEVVFLSAYNNIDLFSEQLNEFRPPKAALAKEHIPSLKGLFVGKTAIHDVQKDLPDLVADKKVDLVIIAMSGAAALDPFLSAVRAGKIVATANKEALVIAGEILMREAHRCHAKVIPVDSEQSAIFQCLEGSRREDLLRVHLTASGGPLLRLPTSRYQALTVKDVLKHPRWKMGAKITVDSATLMNKGFEVIEAQRLFSLTSDQVRVVVHPEALVHSLVEYRDGSMLAQLSVTDMRIPIQYALSYPERLCSGFKGLDLAQLKKLTFEAPDTKQFPALALAREVARRGRTFPSVLNAADEVAVEAFLSGNISFPAIYKVVEQTVLAHKPSGGFSITSIKQADIWARQKATDIIRKVK